MIIPFKTARKSIFLIENLICIIMFKMTDNKFVPKMQLKCVWAWYPPVYLLNKMNRIRNNNVSKKLPNNKPDRRDKKIPKNEEITSSLP